MPCRKRQRVRHNLAHHVDALVRRRIVQRRQLFAKRKLLARLVVDDRRLREVFATCHNAVAHRLDLIERADGRLRVLHQDVEQLRQAFGHRKARHLVFRLLELRRERNVHIRLIRADLFCQALHERNLAVRLQKLAFQARTASVHHEHAHASPFPSKYSVLFVFTELIVGCRALLPATLQGKRSNSGGAGNPHDRSRRYPCLRALALFVLQGTRGRSIASQTPEGPQETRAPELTRNGAAAGPKSAAAPLKSGI